jgi:hypothetical protein
MDGKKKGELSPAQVQKLQDAVSKLEPKDHELLSDELDAVSGGVQESEPIIICVSGCGGAAN